MSDAARHMDGIYRRQRYVYDLSRKYFLLGRDQLLGGLDPPEGGTILEVACGTGRNLILAARRYPSARLYGFDISNEMLDTARSSIARAGLSDRIRVTTGDATRFSPAELFGIARADRVFISYALSMIPPWREALQEAWGAVAPGGSLHIADFGQQSELPGWFRTGLRAWLGRFSVEPRPDLESEMAALASRAGARLDFERLRRDYAWLAVLRGSQAKDWPQDQPRK